MRASELRDQLNAYIDRYGDGPLLAVYDDTPNGWLTIDEDEPIMSGVSRETEVVLLNLGDPFR